MALKIMPYNMGSESARDLAQLLQAKRVKPDSDTYVPRHFDYILNWGSARAPIWGSRAQSRSVSMLNKPEAVNIASNKLSTFQKLQAANIKTPEWTTDLNVASRWLHSGATVVERHELRGNSGEGIRIVNLDDPDMPSVLNYAPLYTKFINKSNEFRVHVFKDRVIDYIEKKRLPSERRPATFNRYISSTHFGWVFARTNILEIPEVKDVALRAVRALGLDFGAVDVVYSEGIAYVLEVNSAPGLGGTTLVNYANAIRRYMGQNELPDHETRHLLDQAANNASALNNQSISQEGELVTLQLDRTTALKLRSLLANIR